MEWGKKGEVEGCSAETGGCGAGTGGGGWAAKKVVHLSASVIFDHSDFEFCKVILHMIDLPWAYLSSF